MAIKQSISSGVGANQNALKLSHTPIAVVGMASLFPKAKNMQTYWENILHEVDCLSEVPASRWNVDDYYDSDPRAEDKTYCRRGGFIPNIDFNLMDFGLPPNVLEATDISQLLALAIAKQAMEDAGYGQDRSFDRDTAGVVLGAVGRQLSGPLWGRLQYPIWERVLKNKGLSEADTADIIEKIKLAYVGWQENSFPGMLSNVIAGRIANRFDFGALNCTLDAACASSLAALKMAVSELVEGRADIMLAGGVDPDNSAFTYLCFSKTPALSRKQHSRPFDADSDGIMLGEGVGMVVLKRLADAERDGDRIYAVIKGLGTSSDGRYKSIYAPRPAGQVKAIQRAYEDAEFSPATVGLIEAHGTGTMAGDPAEFEGLKTVFTANNAKPQSVALGSVKSQIGHTKTAAGIASLIKVTLALHHKVLPPTINVTKPNPRLDIENSPFYLNTKLRPWIRAESAPPRRAGVSSFGFGGTNFHVVLEEYEPEQVEAYRVNPGARPVLLFAATPVDLLQQCQEVLTRLRSNEAELAYADLLQSSETTTIPAAAARVGFVTDGPADVCNKLETVVGLLTNHKSNSWEHPQGIYYRQSAPDLQGKVVALFPGQGSQYLDMGQKLAVNFPELRQTLAALDSLMTAKGMQPVSEVVYPLPVFEEAQKVAQAEQLKRTEYAQPAIGALSAGLYKVLQQAGFQADFAAGHSFGELTALWAAGALSDDDFYALVQSRGLAMATPADAGFDAGTMLAVKGDISQVAALIQSVPDVKIANFNSDQQVVLAGPQAAIATVDARLQEIGLSPILLPVSAAFHTALVAHAQTPFNEAIEQVNFKSATVPVYSNSTGQPYPTDPTAMKALLQNHMVSQVQFKREIEAIYEAGGTCFVEIGPRSVLTYLVKEILGDRPHIAIALNGSRDKDSDLQLRQAVVQLRVAGLPLTHFDPYALPLSFPQTASKGKQLTVQIDGASYVSEKTKLAFEKALQESQPIAVPELVSAGGSYSQSSAASGANGTDQGTSTAATLPAKGHLDKTYLPATNGHTDNNYAKKEQHSSAISSHPNGTAQLPIANGHGALAASDSAYPGSTASTGASDFPVDPALNSSLSSLSSFNSSMTITSSHKPQTATAASLTASAQQVLQSLEQALTHFSQHQSQVLQVHEQYLANHQEYTQAFCRLVQQQQLGLQGKGSTEAGSSVLARTERSLMEFHAHQQETLRVHEQYLMHQVDCSKQFFQMGQQIYNVLTVETKLGQRELPQLEASAFIQPTLAQPASPAAQGTFSSPVISNGNGVSAKQNGAALLQTPELQTPKLQTSAPPAAPAISPMTAAVSPAPTPASAVPSPAQATSPGAMTVASSSTLATPEVSPADSAEMETQLLAVVSDKTGYPVEMLELDMDMEADLGIDSIKRVEILGGLQEIFPNLPQPNLEELAEAELRTLAQVADYMQGLLNKGSAPISVGTAQLEAAPAPAPEPASAPEPMPVAMEPSTPAATSTAITVAAPTELATAVDSAEMEIQLLAVVSDKTGYPVEMLELDMDMEADLGIDSIKRVEILGGLQEIFPNLPQPNLEELAEAELRTLAQVADYMQGLLNKGSAPVSVGTAQLEAAPAPAPEPASAPEPMPVAMEPSAPAATSTAITVAAPTELATAVDSAEMETQLLAVVSDKTGYPVEMLELDMDMEADLGIDSIKRVEILGGLQEIFPNLPQPNLEELAEAELRTLAQVASYMSGRRLPTEKKTLQMGLS